MSYLMKGHKYRDYKHKAVFPMWAELKRDEIRVRVKVSRDTGSVEFLSYADKPLANLAVFADDFLTLSADTGMSNFDMGFEVNFNFNDSYRWVKSTSGLPADLKDVETRWFLYDLPESKEAFAERSYTRQIVLANTTGLGINVSTPLGWWVHSHEEVIALFDRVKAAKFEGLMLKNTTHVYAHGKKTTDWLKVKSEEEVDGIIVGFTEAVSEDGKPLGRAGSVQVRMEDDSECHASGIPHELGADIFNNPDKYINSQWVVVHYMERDRQGGYRHPNLFRLREAK